MKVGILTYHCVPNFGAQLQTLSTVHYLKNHGYDTVVLNWYPFDLEEMYSTRVPISQIEAHNRFVKSYLPVSRIIRTEADIIKVINEEHIEAIIHGSDALFKYQPERLRRYFSKRKIRFVVSDASISVEGIDNNLFWGGYISQLRNVPAVVYAVSSQNCPYYLLTSKERALLRTRLRNFKIITVRDEWTREMVNTIFRKKTVVNISPDPVFALNDNCCNLIPSKSAIIEKYHLPEKYVLVSFWTHHLPEYYVQEIIRKLKNSGYNPVAFPMPEGLIDFGMLDSVGVPLNPMDWYALIKYSNGYIGERMHPIVVALHNSVPFFSFDEYGTSTHGRNHDANNNKMSSKTYAILNKAGLTSNMYSYKYDSGIPSTDEIVDSITHFNLEVCSAFAHDQLEEYMKSMNFILSEFHEI